MARRSSRSFRGGHRHLASALIAGGAAMAGMAAIVRLRTKSAERRYPPRGRFVTVDGVRLHVLERGPGDGAASRRPPVVFLHGNGLTADDFAVSGLLDQIGRTFRAFAFDRPGFGYSERPWYRTWNAETQAELFAAAFRNLGLERPIVVAHSWSTMIALALAARHPRLVSGLVLISGYYYPSVREDVVIFSPPALPLLGDLFRYTAGPFVAEALRPALLRKAFSPQPIPRVFQARFPLALMTRPLQIRAAAEEAAHMIPAAAALSASYGAIACPTVILAGDADAVVDYRRQAERLNRALPNNVLQICSGYGHMLHHFEQERVLQAVRDLADGHQGATAAHVAPQSAI